MSRKELEEDRGDFLPDEIDPLETEEVEDDEDEELPDPDDGEEELDDEVEDEEDSPEDEEDPEDPEDLEEDEEDSPEDEEDPEEDEEDEEDDDIGNKKPTGRVPHGRLKQVIDQRDEERAKVQAERDRSQWLEEQLAELIKQGQASPKAPPEPTPTPEPEYDFDAAEEKYAELLLEGSLKDASLLRREISAESGKLRDRQIEDVKRSLSEESAKSTQSVVEDLKFDDLLTETFEDKPYLDDMSDDYNEKAVKMANSLMSAYVSEGSSRAEALSKAVEDISPLFEKADEDPVPDKKPTLGKEPTDRAKRAKRKANKAREQQPQKSPRQSGVKGSKDLEAISIGKLSEKDFNGLTKKERAELRGDNM